MKLTSARMILILLLVLCGTGVLLLSQENIVVGEGGGNVVRMPVDTRIIELEDPAEAPKLVEEEKKGRAAEAAAPESKPESASQPKPAPQPKPEPKPVKQAEPAKKPTPAPEKQAESKAPAAVGGSITKLDLQATADGAFSVHARGDAPLGKVTYLWLKGPDRLVIDLVGTWRLRTRNVVRLEQGVVKHMVAGEHKDRLRLVVHFRTPPAGMKKPVIQVNGASATVTVSPK
ncbi:AMIN domain-containing protein [Salidesulfovibrio onnuriiensis]|uniref:AMIN domain-containing protein n=1 Tax=Salidesulfovibrio onnuriiensis TaxID=2583823 RepID=UPI0011C6EE22|nr:AMIN domain-containing protein [Salidesulfovibrio onnuriiensis]